MSIPRILVYAILVLLSGTACDKPSLAQPNGPPAAQITPEQAKSHIGERVTVSGVVAQVSASRKGHTYLNFGAAYPNQVFAAVVFASDASQFPDLRSLNGKRVAVTGLVKLYRGKPEIVLTDPADLRL